MKSFTIPASNLAGRRPARFANYSGDVTANFEGTVVGPNTTGEHLVGVVSHYNPETDRTRAGFAYLAPADLAAAVEDLKGRVHK